MLRAAINFSLSLLSAVSAHGLAIVGHTSAANDRFSTGFASAPVPNASPLFIGAAYDWSGVGWNPGYLTQNIAMISDEYFVFSTHAAPGATLSFFSPLLYAANPGDPASAIVTYGVSPVTWRMNHPDTGEPSDLSVGKLTSALDLAHGITSYAILDLGSLDNYIGLELLVYGHNYGASPRIGTNNIDSFLDYDASGNLIADNFAYLYSSSPSPIGEALLQGNDSSGPTFVAHNGRLALTGTHWAVGDISGTTYSADNFIPGYLGQMSGFEITSVPEPSRVLHIAIALLVVRARRRRKATQG